MFGILNNRKSCSKEYLSFRLNYCSLCKSIGKLFGHRERMFLNNDIVFLSEILSKLSNREDDFKYFKINSCFNLPKNQNSIPNFLKFTSSVNIILSYFKIYDNILDSKYYINIWKVLRRIEFSNFIKAKKLLNELSIDSNFIDILVNEQFNRENSKLIFNDFNETIKYYSETTGQITSQVFKQGAILLNKADVSEQLFQIGEKFGEIVYLTDAIKDYDKDIKYNKFNIFRFAITDETKKLNWIARNNVSDYIWSNFDCIKKSIENLPFHESVKNSLINQISSSIKFNIEPISKTLLKNKDSSIKNLSIKERLNLAIKTSKIISNKREWLLTKNLTFISLSLFFILIFLILPSYIYASYGQPQVSTCCGTCLGDCLQIDNCWKCCCGDGSQGYGSKTCGTDTGDGFQHLFCKWPECLGCIGFPLICGCCGCIGESDISAPNVIVIVKEKGCGC